MTTNKNWEIFFWDNRLKYLYRSFLSDYPDLESVIIYLLESKTTRIYCYRENGITVRIN
jgi:hypothetical protein